MGVNKFVASCVGGMCVGCYNDDGQLHVVCDGHGLGCGQVSAELTAELPNAIYPDGSRRLVGVFDTGIELVRGRFDLRPCRHVSDGAVGMYDTVSGRFFGNQGTGAFIPGPATGRYY